ncbi:hypothetical protein DR62_07535 [Burkholderia thailandensis]|uniref:Uncharacterized protein n=1 Tax=Burkholderia thailandensis TaxID=57975 RepID=A0AAW9CVR6_BURTH|nr:hypothetical protein DR62_07535 [Burkholderia thailandensis]AOI55069.1 hypothetical protein WI24_25140 [Burkholderia thailandensis]AOJ54102.1 hypothetical protein AQ475_25280 [Burkholderia thailandensis]MDW9236599.1 hypothetical protein [Burkholderia thailandensis]MDW9253113.1 hypothetical protein [Burkholderia thailandensis]
MPFDATRAAPAIASAVPVARARRGDDARALYSGAFGFLRVRKRTSMRRRCVCPRVRAGGRRLTQVKAALARRAIIPKGWTGSTSVDRA